MNKLFSKIISVTMCASMCAALAACAETDDSVPFLNSDTAEVLLDNPDRGLRMETYITLGENPDSYPGSGEEPFQRAQRLIDKYKSDKPTLSQVYVYLCNYNNRPLDDLALNQLESYFELFRKNNIRMLLRFTYSTESVDDAPYETVKTHLNQLGKFFGDNKELINNTLFCLQTGIIGYWGEGHSNNNLKAKYFSNVIADVRDLAPEGIYTQVRTYDLLKKVAKNDLPYVGIHDDYIIGDVTHVWSFIPKTFKNTYKYNKTMSHAQKTVNDGEMPWGVAKLNDSENGVALNRLDGKAILNQLQTYSLTSFSLEHNYREADNGETFSMEEWKHQYLSLEEAKAAGIIVNPNLFVDSNGNETKMSIYNIIRYHLGYQLALTDYKQTDNSVSFSVINYGFAAPLNFNYFALVCKNKKTGELTEIEITDYDRTKLTSGQSENYTIGILDDVEPVGVKLDTFKNRGQFVRFANDTKFENGVQYFK